MTGAELIAAERRRQIEEEGYDERHDEMYQRFELLRAASSYAIHTAKMQNRAAGIQDALPEVPQWWPWDRALWRPSPDPVRTLAKAGALLAAEIDRLQRAASKASAAP